MRWIILCFCGAWLGCTATCLRDTDCMGASVCTDNRCILIVGSDAGRWASNPGTDTTNTDTQGEPASDAGVSGP